MLWLNHFGDLLSYLRQPLLEVMHFISTYDFTKPRWQQTIMASLDQGPNPAGSNQGLDNIFGAFGAVLGYVGAEAATIQSFECLLWPQRFLSEVTVGSVLKLAFFHPMGGPMHKVALATMDTLFRHGLLKRAGQGHMLGTSFFPDLGWRYTMHGGEDQVSHTELVRNCIWARAFMCLRTPPLVYQTFSQGTEKGEPTTPLRAQVVVGHLTLSKPTPADISSNIPFVVEHAGNPSLRTLLGIVATEASGISVALAIIVAYRSLWSLLWFTPLLLRLTSACFAIHREPLIPLSPDIANEAPVDFEVHCPQSDGNFLLITGPPAIVLQFTRHYGHPARNRFREVLQLVMVVAFGSLFPLGLLFSALWMPLPIQYIWLSYQVYTVLALLIGRYSHVAKATTTEARIAWALDHEGHQERAILFGEKRDGESTIKASLVTTYHTRYREGQQCMARLLSRSKSASSIESDSNSDDASTVRCTLP